jgi:DNA polymerase I-like protein with 3'-5' exonuclease and polymerase domains
LAEDEEPLHLIRGGIDIYEAHARLTMGYDNPRPLKKVDNKLRDLAKVRVLQLGYGSGWYKLYQSAHKYEQLHVFEDPYTKEDRKEFLEFVKAYNINLIPVVRMATKKQLLHYINAFKQVMDFRRKSPKITGYWKQCQNDFEESVGGNYEITLPSGRVMRYFNVRPGEDGLECQTKRGGPFLKFYGSKFVENVCQGTARDVFAEAMLRVVEELDILPCLQVHDELVVKAPVDELPELCANIENIFSQTPVWLGDTPLASESVISPVYTK